jgi:predicted phosphoribosyltransferase
VELEVRARRAGSAERRSRGWKVTETPDEVLRIFRDRREAGRLLAERLSRYGDEEPLVLALPRGGVPVGYEVARALRAPLDVVVARKLGAPGQPELGIGAVAPGGVRVLNEEVLPWLAVSDEYLEAIEREEAVEVERRMRLFRGEGPAPEVKDKTAILVDDGIATGVTARAAIEYLLQQEPRRLVLAVPVCAAQTAEELGSEVDDLVCLNVPGELWAIGLWYEDFEQVSDAEVVELLRRARREREERGAAGLDRRAS